MIEYTYIDFYEGGNKSQTNNDIEMSTHHTERSILP